jgi:DNA-binding response OmpR family regulator
MKVLVADDDQSILNSLEFLFHEKGVECVFVKNGLKAKEALTTQEFDIVISDFMMGDLDGYELLSWIRKRGSDVFFVLMSGYHNDTVAEGFKKLKADMILPKPFTVKDIEACINEFSKRAQEKSKSEPKKDVEPQRKNLLEKLVAEIPGFQVAALLDKDRITILKSGSTLPVDEGFIKSSAEAVISLKKKAIKAQKIDDEKMDTVMITTTSWVFYIKLLDKEGYALYLVASKQETSLSLLQLVINKYVKQLQEAR